MDFKVKGGNSLLVEALLGAVERRNRLHKNVTVTRIEQGPDSAKVFVHGRSEPYEAQFCVCTVPAHCLTKIKWKPDLPLDQYNASTQLQYSRIMKTAVLYAERFWPNPKNLGFSVFSNRASDYCFDSTYRQPGTPGILCSYAIGDKADDLASEDDGMVMTWITEDVARAFRLKRGLSVTPRPIRSKKQPWQRDPMAGGAYAFYRPGQWFDLLPKLSRPFNRVRFAGEHLSEEWQGFMEGAVETGEAAANALIAFAP